MEQVPGCIAILMVGKCGRATQSPSANAFWSLVEHLTDKQPATVNRSNSAHVEHIDVPDGEGVARWHVINRGNEGDGHVDDHNANSVGASHDPMGRLPAIASTDDGTTVVMKATPEKVDHAAMYRPGNVTIACSIRQNADSGVHDPDRGLMRKLADAVFNFVGYRREGEQFRSRNRD